MDEDDGTDGLRRRRGGGRRGGAATVRLYAHRTAAAESAGGAAAGLLTVLAINLANESATLRLSSVGDVARARVLEGDADARASLTGVGGCSAPAKLNGCRPRRRRRHAMELTPATDLGREVTLLPTSLAWLVVPGAARKEVAASLSKALRPEAAAAAVTCPWYHSASRDGRSAALHAVRR